jgi:hypothetical protein
VLGGFKEAARVDDCDFGSLGAVDGMTRGSKYASDFFTIDFVFCASEGDDANVSF